ncbi:MAG: ZIP family metal transporter, partial [Thermoleophilia bacterium]|nr:ZIP family metal transporter [Thermoleophilia bacterium]
MLELVLVATATTIATGLGVIPVAILGERARELRAALLGVASGVMLVAAIVGLLLPALDEGSGGDVVLGLAAGVVFLLVAGKLVGEAPPGLLGDGDRTWVLVFLVLLVHSFPEGFAIGTAYASSTAGLGLFIVVAIAVQNIPEGTSTA